MTRSIEWFHWLATAALLSAAVLGAPWALIAAEALCGAQLAGLLVGSRGTITFKLQVRIVYLALLLAGSWPPLGFIHWVQVVGTWAVVLADYCFLARCLSLAPWNRAGRLTAAEALQVFLRPPAAGAVLQGSVRTQR